MTPSTVLTSRGNAAQAPEFQGDALALSYWLTRSLPLEASSRQALLAEPSAAARLRRTIVLLALKAALRCCHCSAQIAKQTDVVEVSDEGAGGIFVNNHGTACLDTKCVKFKGLAPGFTGMLLPFEAARRNGQFTRHRRAERCSGKFCHLRIACLDLLYSNATKPTWLRNAEISLPQGFDSDMLRKADRGGCDDGGDAACRLIV